MLAVQEALEDGFPLVRHVQSLLAEEMFERGVHAGFPLAAETRLRNIDGKQDHFLRRVHDRAPEALRCSRSLAHAMSSQPMQMTTVAIENHLPYNPSGANGSVAA